MTDSNCPRCGAETVGDRYECWSYVDDWGMLWESRRCLSAQLAAALRRAEVAEEALRGVMVKLSAHPELAFARALEEAAR